MRKYIIIGSVAVFILAAVSVYALQGRNDSTVTAREVKPLPAATSGSGCGTNGSGCGSYADCGGAIGGCSGEAISPTEAKIRTDRITAYLMNYYTKKRGYNSIQIRIEDSGCHQEATITQAGQVIEKLSISGNRITKIGS